MELHHLTGENAIAVLRESAIWEDIERAMESKRGEMEHNAMGVISVFAPSDDLTMIVLVDGYMTALNFYINVLVLDGIAPEEWKDAEFMMLRLRKHKMLDSQKVLIQHGGLPRGIRKPARPDLN